MCNEIIVIVIPIVSLLLDGYRGGCGVGVFVWSVRKTVELRLVV